jgi:Putative peptidoglycan binding domain/D-alanyl-D-alanine carboxypeptidase
MIDLSDEIPFESLPGLSRLTLNGALRASRNATTLALIGAPRGTYDHTCRDPQNPDLVDLLETVDFGPFRATGLRPAMRVLDLILKDMARLEPEVHARLSSAGMLCCRLVRGSATAISSHSWGIAIDLMIDGRLDTWGDNRVQRGLLRIHPIFNAYGFFWGAAFPTEAAMHFEASDQLVRRWAAAGEFGPAGRVRLAQALTIGDRGPEVLTLQKALNVVLPFEITADGIFGKDTRAAVIEVQRRFGLRPDGVPNRRLLHAIGLD